MAEKLAELKKDLEELQNLTAQATRSKVKDILSLEARKLTTEISRLQEVSITQISKTSSAATACASKRYQVKLNTYAWDQTSKFVKFYVTLPKVQTVAQENVVCNFTPKSVELTVKDVENKDYLFTINNLLGVIDPEKSNWKVKSDMVIINAAKVKETDWSHVTELEKKVSDAKADKLKPDDAVDPGDGLMSLMKKMYDSGDDEMKRTIAKAWSESQSKQNVL